jgi:hypothetical protein
MQRAHQGAVADAQLVFQLAQGDAIDVMLHGHVGQQSVAQQMARQHAGRAGSHRAPAARTVSLLQFVADDLAAQRFDIRHGARGHAFVLEARPAVRTTLAHWHAVDAVGCSRFQASSPVAAMARTGTAGSGRGGLGAGFEEDFRGGGGGAKSTFAGGTFLVAQPVFEPGVFLA